MYNIGVSKRAIRSLNKNPLSNKIPNKSHSITPKEQSKKSTEKVSKNWEVMVEKLFLSHKCLPLVFTFQK